MMAAAGGISDTYWINVLSTNSEEEFRWVAVDGDDNVICVGLCELGAGAYDILLSKFDIDGSLQWSRSLGGSSYDIGYGVATDSSNNIILCARSDNAVSSGRDAYVAKYNSSGTLLWDRGIGGSGNDLFYNVAVDTNDNIIAVGYQQSNTNNSADSAFLVVKYNSSGTIQWQRSFDKNIYDHILYGVATDSNDNIFISGHIEAGLDTIVAKLNSSGTSQWQKSFTGGSVDISRAITVDSSDNVIVGAQTRSTGAGNYDFHIIKMNNSDGSVQWQRTLGSSGNDIAEGIATDASGNIYVVGYSPAPAVGANDVIIAKYTSSGSIEWQNYFAGSSTDVPYAVATNSIGTPIFVGWTTSDGLLKNNAFVAKVPQDGLGHGTYGNFTYASSSLTDASSSISTSTQTLTGYNPSLTTGTPSRTSSAQTLTEEFFEIT